MKIKEVILFTSNIQRQKQFYESVLGFEQLVETPEKISFKTGSSILTFQYSNDFKPTHLAFNIPNNLINEAYNWLKNRTEVLDFEGDYITDFVNWKAKAVYFYDPDNNIMEFIARERIEEKREDAFSPKSIISISEMAIVTEDIEAIYNAINQIQSIPVFDGNFDRFCALGNDEGLFVVVDKTKKNWYPTDDEAYISDFIIKGDFNFTYTNGEIKELS